MCREVAVVRKIGKDIIDDEVIFIKEEDVCTIEIEKHNNNRNVCILHTKDGSQYVEIFKAEHYRQRWEGVENFARMDRGSIANINQIEEIDPDNRVAYFNKEKTVFIGIIEARFRYVLKLWRQLLVKKYEDV